jgi:hypothetical protein
MNDKTRYFDTFDAALNSIGLLPPLTPANNLTHMQRQNDGYRVVSTSKGYAIQCGLHGALYAGDLPVPKS